MKHGIFLAALALALAVPAFADDPAPAKSYTCLHYKDVFGWGARDKHSMIVDDRFGRKYLVSLQGICSDLDFSLGMGFRPLGRGGFCVERGDHVIMGGGGASPVQGTCWVTKVQYYTKDMQEADKLARANKQPLAEY